jgi:hypothetical protein
MIFVKGVGSVREVEGMGVRTGAWEEVRDDRLVLLFMEVEVLAIDLEKAVAGVRRRVSELISIVSAGVESIH